MQSASPSPSVSSNPSSTAPSQSLSSPSQTSSAGTAAEHSVQPQETLVIGDRLDREIAAARRLGCWAVRVAHGEGSYSRPTTPDEQPHYTVPGIEALMAVLEDLAAGD